MPPDGFAPAPERRLRSASGAPMDQGAMTAASKKLPLGAKAKVTNLETGKTVDVKINDRGPAPNGRVIDVSKQAASQLGIKKGAWHP